jgi:hypothetical protein
LAWPLHLARGEEGPSIARIRIIVAIGGMTSAVGIFLCLQGSELATTWQPTQSGNGWGGRTDPALQHTYYILGIVGLCFGLLLLAGAAWAWMTSSAAASERPSIEM